MSIEYSFDPGPAIIEPTLHTAPHSEMPETIVTCFSWEFKDILSHQFDLKQVTTLICGDKVPIYAFTYKDKTFGFYRSMLGGPASALLLEKMIAAGARRFLYFGSCGSLDPAVTAGHLIIPTAARRDEGTSYHYVPAGDFMPVRTADRLAAIFDAMKIPYRCVKTWTTDAFYRETPAKVEARKAEGCSVVEMECASVMAVGAFRDIDVYHFLYTADSLAGGAWDRGILGSTPDNLREQILTIALEAAYQL